MSRTSSSQWKRNSATPSAQPRKALVEQHRVGPIATGARRHDPGVDHRDAVLDAQKHDGGELPLMQYGQRGIRRLPAQSGPTLQPDQGAERPAAELLGDQPADLLQRSLGQPDDLRVGGNPSAVTHARHQRGQTGAQGLNTGLEVVLPTGERKAAAFEEGRGGACDVLGLQRPEARGFVAGQRESLADQPAPHAAPPFLWHDLHRQREAARLGPAAPDDRGGAGQPAIEARNQQLGRQLARLRQQGEAGARLGLGRQTGGNVNSSVIWLTWAWRT